MKKYRIWDTSTNEYEHCIIGAGTNRTQTWFDSIKQARQFNCHGIYEDKVTYKIHEFSFILDNDDADPANEEDIVKYNKKQEKLNRQSGMTIVEIIQNDMKEMILEMIERTKINEN